MLTTTTTRCHLSQYVFSRHRGRRNFSTTCKKCTHYETLGLSPAASKSQIKSHFYKLSKLHHPDVSKDPKSQALFRKATDAYAVLSNDREKRAYDRSLLHRGPTSHSQQPFHPHAPSPKAPRASHAWEYRARASRKPPAPDYPYSRNPSGDANPNLQYDGTQAYRHAMHHDVLVGSRRKLEEDDRKVDKIRNEVPFLRAIQVTGLLLLAATVFSGFGR